MKKELKSHRNKLSLTTKTVAQQLGVDQSLISKFENGTRIPTEKQIVKLSIILNIPQNTLMTLWLKTKILTNIKNYPVAKQALQMAQEELKNYNIKTPQQFSEKIQNKLIIIDNLKEKLQELRNFDSYRIAEALELEYTFESNRIEGNTLTLRETDFVINEGLTVSGKSMREHLEAINHSDAIHYIKELQEKKTILSQREVLLIHNLVLRGIDQKHAGVYRTVDVMIKGSKHKPPQPYLIPKQMEEYFEWYLENKNSLHPVLLAAEMHEQLVTIHPFIDGNGRTSRLIMNLILLANGFVIANIKGDFESRMRYYEALEETQTTGNKEPFYHFILDVEIECLERYLSILS
ncbi:MAG: Fic family protein [Lishizhenia sp.]